MSTYTKPSNPKDAIGSKKLAMHLVPSIIQAYASLAFTEGALKYGKYNWRVAGVRLSIYLDAIHRHLAKLQNGEWADKATRVPHLASIIACAGIIADARLHRKLTDDRPPEQVELSSLLDGEMAMITQHLQDLFKDHNPVQYNIENTKVIDVVFTEVKKVKRDSRRKSKSRRR